MKKMIYVIMFALLPLFAWAENTENYVEVQQPEVAVNYSEVTNVAPGMWINWLGQPLFYSNFEYTFIAENTPELYVWEISGDATIVRVNEVDEYGNPKVIGIRTNPICHSSFTLKLKAISSGIVVEEVTFVGRIIPSRFSPCY